MNARITILKSNFPLLSIHWKPIYLYTILVFTILLGTVLLQRFAYPNNYRALGNIPPTLQPYVAFAEELCRQMAPPMDRCQIGAVIETTPTPQSKGYVSIQLSDLENRHHYHVFVEKDTGELLLFSQVTRGVERDFQQWIPGREPVKRQEIPGERKAAMAIAKRSLDTLYDAGAIQVREPLGVTVGYHDNWMVQWHFRDCCMTMEIQTAEKRMATFHLRRHPQTRTQPVTPFVKGHCSYCPILGVNKALAYEKSLRVSPSSNP